MQNDHKEIQNNLKETKKKGKIDKNQKLTQDDYNQTQNDHG